jgi:energy-coupling factor transporter ATP-binding protein EcfA2
MKIKTIEINNYKAFYGKQEIKVEGKNLFIYGENGSGKSSLYYALKDFFQSSHEDIDLSKLENIFIPDTEKGKGYIKVTFNPDKDGNTTDKVYNLTAIAKDTFAPSDTSIRDAISLKSFLTYKHLLGIHFIKKNGEIDLFDLLVKGVLLHFKSVAITGSKELGELWYEVENAVNKPLDGRIYNSAQKEKDVTEALGIFNKAFGELFNESSPEYILKATSPILDDFKHSIRIKLNYIQARPIKRDNDIIAIENNHVKVKLWYAGKEVEKPHLFLNEARLSAIAISIYLGMIKRHPQSNIKAKILFLDDIFIGLDISNRLPLLEILKKEFSDYQIFITTYDKPWYEYAKFYLHGDKNWKCFEFYSRKTQQDFEVPIVISDDDKTKSGGSHVVRFITVAEDYFSKGDNKAAGVYIRSAFEFILKRFCYGKVPVKYMASNSDLDTDDFWVAIKKYKNENPTKCNLTTATEKTIEQYRKFVLNPLNHLDVEKHEISAEIQGAIDTVKTLKTELGV